MKYIRTKDGKIYNKSKIICSAFREEYCSPNWNEDIEKYLQTKIVAEADTIEELCDGFYLDNEEYELVDRFYYYHKQYDCFKSFANSHRGFSRSCFKEYKADLYLRGFIKTDKGLIYVAKMNDKGELELL